MKMIVVGASGFVGRHILASARAGGYQVIGTQSRSRGGDLIPFDLACDRLGDRVPRSWFMGDGPLYVVVAAAIPQPDRCLRERELSFQTNVTGTARLLQDAMDLGAVPVFLSSSFVFDGRQGHYGDRDTRKPISEYGRQKAEIEALIEKTLPSALVLRLDKTVGDDPAERHLLSEWWELARAGKSIRCIQGQVFSVTLVNDVARGVLLACEHRLRGTYNLASPEYASRVGLAERFLRSAGLTVAVEEVSQGDLGFAELRAEKSWLDSRALMAATGLAFTPVREIFTSFLRAVGQIGDNEGAGEAEA